MRSEAERQAVLSGAVNRVWGEEWTFRGRTAAGGDVNARRVLDPSRLDFTVTGILTDPGRLLYPKARKMADDGVVQRVADKPVIDAETVALLWRPVQGDIARREVDGSEWAVSSSLEDGFGRTYIRLTGQRAR